MKKNITMIVGVIVILTIIGAITFSTFRHSYTEAKQDENTFEYETKLFDNSYVHTIDITIDEGDLKAIYASPLDKTKYPADVTIDGETIENSSIATKGSNSLKSVAADESSNRYSYKIIFDKYVDGQTYYGLDQLILQNNVSDPSSLKSFLAFEMFRHMGVAAPLTSYALVTINGKEPSLYTIMEAPKEVFMTRNGLSDSNMYKPDWTEEINGEDHEHVRNEVEKVFGSTKIDHGIYLKYSDDNISSYNDIFENAVNTVDDEDKIKLIAALKILSEGDGIESVLDTDEIITYFAVHNFIENYDSYVGGFSHNYYLCEKDGVLSMLPWDYDRGFAPFINWANVDTQEFINQGIDTPLMYCNDEDRPMWTWIQNHDEYREKYHEIMAELIAYCEEELGDLISGEYKMIRPYLAEDVTTKITLEESDEAARQLELFVEARTQSIRKQLEGTLATKTEEQNPEDRIDCAGIDPMKTTRGLETWGGR